MKPLRPNKKEKLPQLQRTPKLDWLKLLFETPRLGIEKEPGVIVDLETEYRSLRNNYYCLRR